ncbi:hypothetical protein GCM10023189_00910 [Nibrella saemangeumensis]|uniref:Uncharacterized protein n=1 Tax=Nibrella saemangeumensis TaxID=1084526 RepID=A0ABP8MA85_9BACT
MKKEVLFWFSDNVNRLLRLAEKSLDDFSEINEFISVCRLIIEYSPYIDEDDVNGFSIAKVEFFYDELFDNFINITDDKVKLNYETFLKQKLEPLSEKAKIVTSKSIIIDNKIRKGELDEDKVIDNKENTLFGFNLYLDELLGLVGSMNRVLDEHLETFINPKSQKVKPNVSRKKKEYLTHKQQMVLADILGLLNHPILEGLNATKKGVILGNLMQINPNDTRNMLSKETRLNREDLRWDNELDINKVLRFLKENGVDKDRFDK